MTLDKQERLILRELIRYPRVSDNQIAQNTRVPLKTVNRKRKLLEEKNVISYYSSVDRSEQGTGTFQASYLYIITLAMGVTRKQVKDMLYSDAAMHFQHAKHIKFASIGERDGRVVLLITIESRVDDDIVEIFNADIVKQLSQHLGHRVIHNVESVKITHTHRIWHNYLPGVNMENGNLSKHWPVDNIFVDD